MQLPSHGLNERHRSIEILARSLCKELRAQGYQETQIVALASQLLGEVTTQAADKPKSE